jgi:hypothetical protein
MSDIYLKVYNKYTRKVVNYKNILEPIANLMITYFYILAILSKTMNQLIVK